MYTFDARNGESLSLRPEGTAGCVRAVLQHGLSHQNQASVCGTAALCIVTSDHKKVAINANFISSVWKLLG